MLNNFYVMAEYECKIVQSVERWDWCDLADSADLRTLSWFQLKIQTVFFTSL